MFESRDDIRQRYCDIYHRMTAGEIFTEPMEKIISEIIRDHPEYHSLLSQTTPALHTEFNPEDGQPNPFLHMGMHNRYPRATQNQSPRWNKKTV